MILVLGLVLFVEQFLKLRHLPNLRLSVFVFVPKQKRNHGGSLYKWHIT